ncbi:MAG TPA: hypothetical protein VH138_14615 [Vicinamibacterales bacterium]|jgi:hypothetical protein|nr:hypothetical protein [Vicinamibacterales bacterium]
MRALAVLCGLLLLRLAQAPPPQTQAQSRPVFRGGTHFVRVDAYPIQNGTIVEGLKANDFEITVKLKGQTIRARREYRAATQAEIAALANRPAPSQVQSGPPSLVGEPLAYRVAFHQAPEKTSRHEFERTERLRVEWPVLAPLDRREARLLGSGGKTEQRRLMFTIR